MLVFAFSALLAAVSPHPFCNAEVCPERQNDFVWENDKFGMRAYGPGEYHKWSGFDVFNKSNPSNVCLKWCHRIDRGDFHKNRGEGMDNYAIGPSRGVGGIAIFADGEWKTYPNWISSRVLHVGPDYCQFELTYPACSAAGRMTCRITLKRGEHFFRNDVSFEKKFPKGFLAGPGLDLNPKRGHSGNLQEAPGVVSLFEDPKGENGADGSTMTAVFVAPEDVSGVKSMTDHTESRVLAFDRNRFTYWAGAGWSLAGGITDAAAWHDAVRSFREGCSPDPSPSEPASSGISKSGYLDFMEAAVRAYSDERLVSYCDEAERDGVQEHGFPRLAANLAVLVANGRLPGKRDLARRMMDVACRDAKKGKMPPKSGGNEFSVKELSIALAELERRQTFPKSVTAPWRKLLRAVNAEKCYSRGLLAVGAPRAYNWVVFACASDQARLRRDLGGDPGFVEKYVADQIRWFDSNGMYRDPHQPTVYDLVTRLQFAQILDDGYSGPSSASLEYFMDLSAEPTLKLLSSCGEIPYGGRSNQFLHNNTLYSALCEWYAARFARRGDMAKASEFRRAAVESADAMDVWLAERPVNHVKNRYPRKAGKGVYSEESDIGCERYAYFDKYMITMGSNALHGWYFADETIPAAEYAPARPEVFLLSPTFHIALMRAGEYSAQFDYGANAQYDCNGLGRLHRRGAPAELCLSTPCAEKTNYRLPEPNRSSLSIRPAVPANAGWRILHEARTESFALTKWRVGDLDWDCRLSAGGMEMELSGDGEVAMDLPAFEFDGRDSTCIANDATSLSIAHRGWVCRYRTDGRIAPTGVSVHNRNGRYAAFRATGAKKLKVWIEIVPRSGR